MIRVKKTIIVFAALLLTAGNSMAQVLTDIDGNQYQTININGHLWMQENLKTTHYADGSNIPLVNTVSAWNLLSDTSKAYCYYDDDSTTNAGVYGALYTWAAAMNGAASDNNVPGTVQGVCPAGWHLPTDAEWHLLALYLDPAAVIDITESYIAGGKMKETGTAHWNTNTGGTNESGFTGLPSGRRMETGVFTQLTYNAMWWTSTASAQYALDRTLYYCYERVDRGAAYRKVGYAVRCLCDTTTAGIPEIDGSGWLHTFPNPANGMITVTTGTTSVLTLDIFNITGNCILHHDAIMQPATIDISRLAKGIYLLRITDGDRTAQRKLIVD